MECTGDFTVTNMQTLADCCRDLTSVKLMGPCTYSTEEANHPRVDAALTALVQNNTNIYSLELFSFLRLSDTSLLAIAQSLRNLRVFSLYNCEGSFTGLSTVRTSCTKLQTFEVHLQSFIPTLNGVREVGYIQLSKITSLVIYSTTLTDAQLVTLAQTNRSMHTIRINPPYPIEGPLLSPNALCEALSYWPTLEKFDVRMPTSPRYRGALRMDDTVIYALALHCPKVSTVYLSGHANLSNEAISALSNLPLLHTFAANHCVNLLDSGVSIVAEKCPLLQVIELAHCAQITNAGIHALALHSRRLVRVNLQECEALHNNAVQHHISRARHLKILNIALNPLLTFAAVAELPKYCLCMTHLRLYNTLKKPLLLEFYSAYRSNRRYFDIIFGWSAELRNASE